MCIKRSVGLSGRNDLMDVTIVQILLNLNLPRFTAPKPVALKTDGRIGPGTLKLLTRFETEVMKQPSSDQMVVPGDASIKALLAGLPPGPSKETPRMRAILSRSAIAMCAFATLASAQTPGEQNPLRDVLRVRPGQLVLREDPVPVIILGNPHWWERLDAAREAPRRGVLAPRSPGRSVSRT